MKNIKSLLSILVGSILITGCATITSGTTQKVNVQAMDKDTQQVVEGAVCEITNSKGVVTPVKGNPGKVILSREYGAIETSCRRKGYKQDSVNSGQSFNAWTLGNIIFWPGAIVDTATGAAAKYPSHITVLMQRIGRK